MLKVVIVSNWFSLRIHALERITQSEHRICGMMILPYSGKKAIKRILTNLLARIPAGLRISGYLAGQISSERVKLSRTARLNKVRIYEVTDINAPAVIFQLRQLAPDVIIIIAWPKKFGIELLKLPTLGCINCHPSLLPLYRGPNPIPHAILSGDSKTGVTFHFMNEEFDTGDIILQKEVSIRSNDNSQTLRSECSKVAIDSLVELLDNLETGKLHSIPQDPKAGSYAPKLKHSDRIVDWEKTTDEIDCKMRALLPWFSSYTYHDKQQIVITEFEKRKVEPRVQPGQIVNISDAGMLVSTKDAGLFLQSFVLAGLDKPTSQQYLANEVKEGDILRTSPC